MYMRVHFALCDPATGLWYRLGVGVYMQVQGQQVKPNSDLL